MRQGQDPVPRPCQFERVAGELDHLVPRDVDDVAAGVREPPGDLGAARVVAPWVILSLSAMPSSVTLPTLTRLML